MDTKPLPPIAFIHLPRTAGTSLGAAIAATYGARAFRVKTMFQADESLASQIGPDVEIVYGHMLHGLHRYRPVRYATVLRDPIERALSHFRLYQFQMQHKFGAPRPPSFDEFLANHFSDNLQSRFLAGVEDDEAPPGTSDRAIQNLEEFEAVGFFDDLDGFAHRIGVDQPLRRSNNRGDPYRATPDELEHLRLRNQQDMALYGWARERFGPLKGEQA